MNIVSLIEWYLTFDKIIASRLYLISILNGLAPIVILISLIMNRGDWNFGPVYHHVV